MILIVFRSQRSGRESSFRKKI